MSKPWETRARGAGRDNSQGANLQHPADRRKNDGPPPKPQAKETVEQRQPQVIPTPFEAATDDLIGSGEVGLSIAGNALAEPIAGIAGMVTQAIPGGANGGETVEAVRDYASQMFAPRTEQGQQKMQAVGSTMEPVGEVLSSIEQNAGDYVFELTGSPALAAAAVAAPTALMELVGIGALRKVRAGTRLIDDQGRPTKVLQIALDEQGLNFDNLSPETRALIPLVADPGPVGARSVGANVDSTSEAALIAEIEKGSRDSALGGLKVKEGTFGKSLEADKLAAEAIRQGFSEGAVQAIKTANPATRKKMLEMLRVRRRILQNESLTTEISTARVTGDALGDRVKFIRDSVTDARKSLDAIAKTKLSGKAVDVDSVVMALNKELESLNIRNANLNPTGKPEPIYMGSQISQDPTSQKIINRVIALLEEPGTADAARLHNLKRQLDRMIDFQKKGKEGLTDAGRDVAKAVRYQINQSLRVIPEYAAVNDTMYSGLTALDNFQQAVGTNIDMFAENSNLAIGNRARAIMSRQQKAGPLLTAIDELDDTAFQFGADFSDNIKDLARFEDTLDTKFGTTVRTSLQGDVEKATMKGVVNAMTDNRNLTSRAFDAAVDGFARASGIDDLSAMRAMEDLLRRQENYVAPQTRPKIGFSGSSDFNFDPDTGLLNDNR